ncbi:hypothetical protein ACJX0J_007473, partial [Zea mays]
TKGVKGMYAVHKLKRNKQKRGGNDGEMLPVNKAPKFYDRKTQLPETTFAILCILHVCDHHDNWITKLAFDGTIYLLDAVPNSNINQNPEDHVPSLAVGDNLHVSTRD